MSSLSSKLSSSPDSEVVFSALAAPLPPGVTPEDVEGVAWAAYHRWSERVVKDPEACTQGYLYTMIRNAIIDEARRLDRLSAYTRGRLNRIRSVTDSLKASLGRTPNLNEVSEATGISADIVRETLFAGEAAHDETFGSTLSFVDIMEIIPSDGDDPSQGAAASENEAILQSAFAELTEDQRRVLQLVVIEGMPVSRAAKCVNTTAYRIKAIQESAMAKLRRYPPLRELAEANR